MSLIWDLIKRLGPYLFVAAVIAGCVAYGWHLRNNDFKEYITAQQVASQKVQDEANARNASIQKTVSEYARIINETNAKNTKANTDSANHLRNLIDDRVRNTDSNTSGLSKDTGIIGISQDETFSTRLFLETGGQDTVTLAEKAAKINESLRSCQDEYEKLRSTVNGESK